jgi:hypothetical protein
MAYKTVVLLLCASNILYSMENDFVDAKGRKFSMAPSSSSLKSFRRAAGTALSYTWPVYCAACATLPVTLAFSNDTNTTAPQPTVFNATFANITTPQMAVPVASPVPIITVPTATPPMVPTSAPVGGNSLTNGEIVGSIIAGCCGLFCCAVGVAACAKGDTVGGAIALDCAL